MIKSSVSVLIPFYNASNFIYKTIQSVLNQNIKIEKIIVVDDGSTDDSLDILKKFGDRILVLQHKNGKNRGQAFSLNVGLEHIDSEFVAFLDADDFWDEDKLACQIEILKNNPEYLLCYTNGYVVDSLGSPLYPILPAGFEEKNSVGNILLDCYIRTPSMVMARRSLFDQVGFFFESFSAPDHDMWIRASEAGSFYFLNRNMVGYRQHPGQLSVNYARKMWENGFTVLERAIGRFSYPESLCRKRKAFLFYRIANCDLRERKFSSATMNFWKSFMYDPLRVWSTIYFFNFRQSK